jgi:flagellin
MSLSILNNVAALYAQNNINSTQSSLQKTLQQLSSGSRINSGADDPSGLAVSDGLNANEAALTQSATNATEGIGMLQTADGALSQVTSLLDQAISIATEIGGGTLTGSTTTGQIGSANQEYSNILSQIADIGSSTNYNSTKVFTDTAVTIGVSDGTSSGTSSYADTVGTLTTSNVGSAQASGTASNVGSTTAGTGATATLALAVGNATNTVGGTLTIDGGSST